MRKEALEVGTILQEADGHVLVTPAGKLRLMSHNTDLDDWQDQRVLIAGERIHADGVLVSEVYSMMSERELSECASFVLSRHGHRAREHALARLDSALARNHPRDVEIWKSICRRIDLALARDPWPKK